MTLVEAAILAKLSRGEAVTPLKANGRMTPEVNTAAVERQARIGQSRSR